MGQRLIDANLLLSEFDVDDKTEFDTVGVRYYIQAAPTVEAVPVVFGRWKTKRGNYVTGGGNPLWCCSNCEYIVGAFMSPPKDNYCPNCGAVMDKNSLYAKAEREAGKDEV